MKRLAHTLLPALLLAPLACSAGAEVGGGHGDESGEHGSGGEVRVSKAAMERGGIRVVSVSLESVVGGIDVPAEIKLNPDRTAHVTPLVPGQITEVHVSLGDTVAKDDVLAVLRSVALGEARSEVAAARAAVEVARANFERQEKLSKEGIGSHRNYLEARAALRKAEADLASVVGRLRVYGGRGGAGSTTPIRSPLDGVIIERHATAGEVVSTERPLFVVADMSRVWVIGRLYEQDVAAARVGAAVTVTLLSYPGRSWRGSVSYVASTLDEHTRTLRIRVELDNPEGILRPGLFGSIALSPPGESGAAVLVVPEDAVQRFKGLEVVFVAGEDEGEFHATPVKTGVRIGGRVEIREGLEEGARIVAAGAFTLKSELLKGELGEGHAD